MTLFDNKLEIIREKSILGDAVSEIEKKSSISSSKESDLHLDERNFEEFGTAIKHERKSLLEKSTLSTDHSKIHIKDSEDHRRRFTNI
jgi:hypothetical protein